MLQVVKYGKVRSLTLTNNCGYLEDLKSTDKRVFLTHEDI